jgi:cobaltochelatase CobT
VSKLFETTLEKIGRIISRQHGIEIVCEGNVPCTDGEKIYLPQIDDMTEELKRDFNGFLDHEVAHIKFTEFDEIKLTRNEFHGQLLNATEDERIERKMISELPGCKYNLDHINDKFGGLNDKARAEGKMGIPQRIISSIRDIMAGKEDKTEADIKDYIDAVRPYAEKLNDCQNTKELRETTGTITRLIDDKKKEKEEKEEKEEKGKGKKGPKGKAGDEKGEGAKGPSNDGSDEWDEELAEAPLKDLEGMMEDEVKKHLAKGGPKRSKRNQPYLAMTTRFDEVIDETGKGDHKKYTKMKREVQKYVGGIRRELERILKVQENARWNFDKERGKLSQRSLSRLASDPSYRRIFKEFTKEETTNVAVQILIDESGSMYDKVKTAQMATIAMAEALTNLGISFEVTGFTSEGDHRMYDMVNKLEAKDKGSTDRFTRKGEKLRLGVYKRFDASTLNGLTKLQARCQNPDGECLRWAAKRLSQQKQKRKILIVMSDGQPATGEMGLSPTLENDLISAVKEITKHGMEVVAFGIQTEAPKKYYKDYVIIDNLNDLATKTMKKLSKIITRR